MNLLKDLRLKGRILPNEPLCRHTAFRIGGPVDIWAEPQDLGDIKDLLEISKSEVLPLFVIGNGSNLLISDEGLRGIAVSLRNFHPAPCKYSKKENISRCGVQAGAGLQKFILDTMELCYTGLEFMAGIPGSIGGAVRTNAGAGLNGPWISDFIDKVKVCDYSGNVSWIEKRNIKFDYRDSGLTDLIILEAEFNLKKAGNKEILRKEYQKFLIEKKKKQELTRPSAGCVFKNPKGSALSAAQLIEGCGLKGRRVGDAMVSAKHANFIVNAGKATFKDVMELIGLCRNDVLKKYGIELETEIEILK